MSELFVDWPAQRTLRDSLGEGQECPCQWKPPSPAGCAVDLSPLARGEVM
jgi:hypothetical protein